MKKFLKDSKLLCLFLACFIIISSFLSVNVFSASYTYDENEHEYTEITLLSDNKTVICGDKTYYCFSFEPKFRFWLDPITEYRYANVAVRESDGRKFYVNSSREDSEIIWLEDLAYGYVHYCATKDAKYHIENFFVNEKFAAKRLWTSAYTYADVSAQYIDDLQNLYMESDTVFLMVKDLGECNKYRLAGYDRTDTFAYNLGYIYESNDGNFYYVSHSTLDENYFDTNGNFIYIGSGKVEAVVLSGNTLNATKQLLASAAPAEFSNTYENEVNLDDSELDDLILVAFWVVYFIFGIAAPIPVIIIGFILGRKKKNEHPKYWRSIAFSACAWLFISLVLLAILLII